MALYDFFVGSTARHDAHNGYRDAVARLFYSANLLPRVQNVYGVWEGETENVAQYTVELADDAAAQRVAYGLAILTGNDAVLVSRLAIKGEESLVFGSTRAYRVSEETRFSGNRTIVGNPFHGCNGWDETPGYAYVPDSRGSHVAYLVWSDARVTAVD